MYFCLQNNVRISKYNLGKVTTVYVILPAMFSITSINLLSRREQPNYKMHIDKWFNIVYNHFILNVTFFTSCFLFSVAMFDTLTPFCTYWEQHYTICRERIPLFLERVANKILNTGKYLNVVRQCGRKYLFLSAVCPYVRLSLSSSHSFALSFLIYPS